jgi:hypothetical protein
MKKERSYDSLRFRGSENQRILRCKASLQTGEPVLWEA